MREGKLTYGTSATESTDVRLVLADTRNPYRPVSRMLWPQRTDIAGADPEDQAGDTFIRRWSQNRWDRGELNDLWEPGGYRRSSNVRPDRRGDRLELGAYRETAQHDGTADFAEGIRLGRGLSQLWAVDDATVHAWQPTTEDFDQTGWATGATTQTATTICQEGDGVGLFIGYDDKSIRRVTSTYNLEVYSATASTAPSYNPELSYRQGVVYYLDGADLYSLTTPAIGANWTFDFTGGASEDLWTTSTAHGLSVDDAINFTTDGGGAPEYAANTRYWVVAVPSTTTLQLSATKGGAVLEGTADSSGNWAAEQLDKRTSLADPGGDVADYMASSGNIYRRMCVTDVGVAWLVPEDDGTTTIWEYNEANQTDYPSGKLPVEFAFPYSIHFAHGFIFVGYRYGSTHAEAGPAYIYYQRGGQWGSAGPVRLADTSSASQPVVIGGVIGDDLVFYYGKALWGYDLSAGALFQIAASQASAPTGIGDVATFGKDVFVTNVDGAAAVERFNTEAYTTDDASWDSGRFDFDLPGIKKALLRITAVVDPLPASTQITCQVAADGNGFTAIPGTFDTDNETKFTWIASESGGTNDQVTGYDFEIRLIPDSTVSTSTPQIREVFCEAVSANKRRVTELDVALTDSNMGLGASGTRLLSQLRDAAEFSGAVVKLTDPWGVAEHEPPDVREVVVELLGGYKDQEFATLRVWDVNLA